jgi:hypothetical protein
VPKENSNKLLVEMGTTLRLLVPEVNLLLLGLPQWAAKLLGQALPLPLLLPPLRLLLLPLRSAPLQCCEYNQVWSHPKWKRELLPALLVEAALKN